MVSREPRNTDPEGLYEKAKNTPPSSKWASYLPEGHNPEGHPGVEPEAVKGKNCPVCIGAKITMNALSSTWHQAQRDREEDAMNDEALADKYFGPKDSPKVNGYGKGPHHVADRLLRMTPGQNFSARESIAHSTAAKRWRAAFGSEDYKTAQKRVDTGE